MNQNYQNQQQGERFRPNVKAVSRIRPGLLIGVGLMLLLAAIGVSMATGMFHINIPQMPGNPFAVSSQDTTIYGKLNQDIKNKDDVTIAKKGEIFPLKPSESEKCPDCYRVEIGGKMWDIPAENFQVVDDGGGDQEVSSQSETTLSETPEVEAQVFQPGMMLILWVDYVDPAGAFVAKSGSLVQVAQRMPDTPAGMTRVLFQPKGIKYYFNVFSRYLTLPGSNPPSSEQPTMPTPPPPVGGLTPVELTIGEWFKNIEPLFSVERWRMAAPWEYFVVFTLGLLMLIFSLMDAAQNRSQVANVNLNQPSWTGIIGTLLTPFVFVMPAGLPSIMAMGLVCFLCLRPRKERFYRDVPIVTLMVVTATLFFIWQFSYLLPWLGNAVRILSMVKEGPWLVLLVFFIASHFWIGSDRSSLATLLSFQSFWILFTGQVPSTNLTGSMVNGSLYVAWLTNGFLNIDAASRFFYVLAFASIWLRVWEQVLVRSADPDHRRQGGALLRGILLCTFCTAIPVLLLMSPDINLFFLSAGIGKIAAILIMFFISIMITGSLIGTGTDEIDEATFGDTFRLGGVIVIPVDAVALWMSIWATLMVAFPAVRSWFT